MSSLSKSTELTLLRNWDSPEFFFPVGMVARVEFFARLLGLTSEEFIEKYEGSLYVGWFEIPVI